MTQSSKRLPLSLLPTVAGLHLDQVTIDGDTIALTIVSTQIPVTCPLCHAPTTRLHSHYGRTVVDLPWGRHAVRVHLRVRRFRCPVATCQRRVFAERLPALVAPHARRTTRLCEVVRLVAVALGGEAGARLIDRLGMPTSPSTLLRAIRQATRPTEADPRVIGIDDFALRHGQRYGTVIVDLEHGNPADLLPDRLAPTVASWLAAHPGVAIITRDRSTEYARGIAAGASQAIEVLDRWHVHKNVREAVERFLSRHQHTLGAIPLPEVAGTEADDVASGEPPPRSRGERAARQAKRERRLARYEAVRDLHAQGVSMREIGRRLGLSRWAVRHDIDAHAFPERQRHRRQPSMLDPFEPYLRRRWAEGCRNGMQLWRELRAQGYPGSRKRVAQWVQQRRLEPAPTTPGPWRQAVAERAAAGPPPPAASTRQLTWLVLRDPEHLTSAERAALVQMRETCREVDVAYPLIQEFLRILRQRTPDALDAWFIAAAASGIRDIQTFADGLQRDQEALWQALVQPWSNGPTEGFVNKIKLIKRQMFGRASFDLLRQRVLLAA